MTAAPERPSLTSRQLEILDYIVSHTTQVGYPPSMREIARHIGVYSTSSVSFQLFNLEMKGYIRREFGKPRAMKVIA